eukprot:m.114602 g.114602  ORF g.114602 m.114602 type:complete len:431 (-) comp14173_c0_seq5:6-1298(-)
MADEEFESEEGCCVGFFHLPAYTVTRKVSAKKSPVSCRLSTLFFVWTFIYACIYIPVSVVYEFYVERVPIQRGYVTIGLQDAYGPSLDSSGNTSINPRAEQNYKIPQYCSSTPDVTCLYWSNGNAIYPRNRPGNFYLTSYVEVIDWSPANYNISECNIHSFTNRSCEYKNEERKKYFIPNVEEYEVSISHSMSHILEEHGKKSEGIVSTEKAEGELVDRNGNVLQLFNNETRKNPGIDIVNVSYLLRSAVTNDELKKYCGDKNSSQCFYGLGGEADKIRVRGLNLLIKIEWHNNHLDPISSIAYKYTAEFIPDLSSNQIQVRYNDEGNKRMVFNRSSIHGEFIPTGTLSQVSFESIRKEVTNMTVWLGYWTALFAMLLSMKEVRTFFFRKEQDDYIQNMLRPVDLKVAARERANTADTQVKPDTLRVTHI